MPDFVSEPIAIVGYSCRFPGEASTPSKLWDLLKDPRDVLKEIPATRFNPKGFYHPDGEYHGSTNVKHAYILDEDHRVFDNEFFGITPKEAESMDPQQRMLLETVYEGIETAGYSLEQLRGSPTAVFVGMMNSDYTHILFGDPDNLPPYTASGIALSIMANRVSYFFDWKGPSVVIDTACSSSMVALHQAVQALRNGEAEVAVAAGTNLILGPEMFIAESKLHMLSPTGGSRMWDASVDGYTRGEGLVSLILKPLSRAIADNDSVRCIIRETGVNQDGRTLGLTVPSATAQAELIRATYGKCGLDLTKATDRPQYFEAHGTGTPAGDPIEAEAIQHVFYPTGTNYTGDEKLLVGSIKTVIGHLEGSAGLAGVLKSVLAIQQGFVPPNLHFNRLNPKVEPFYDHLCVPRRITPWPSLPPNAPRRVSVNSFGFGGTNAHVILESWQLDSHVRDRDDYSAGIFVLSAASAQGLASMGIELGSYLERYPKTNLNDLSYTLSRRSQFNFRASFSATSTAQLVHKLASATLAKTSRVPTILETLPPRILAVFTGQGAQWPTMGRELYLGSALFRSRIDVLQNSLDALPDPPDWTLAEQLISSSNTSRVLQAGVSQPLCTAIQVALVDLLRYIGISFSAAVGHSSGEIGAAYAAGYIDAGDAVRIAYYRGVFAYLARGPEGQKGKMLAVGMSFEQAASFCRELGVGRLRVAASNSQLSCTLSGDADAIDEAKGRLESQGKFARLLMVDTAYHSHHMDPCADLYLEALLRCNIKVQGGLKQCEWYSSVYGADGRRHSLASNNQLNAQYWVDNMTQPVLFSQAVQRAMTEENCHDLVLEIGPHPALKGPVSNIIKALIPRSLPYSGVLSRGRDALETFADAVGFVWERFSCSKPLVNLNAVSDIFSKNDSPAQAVLIEDLPSYCWDHERIFWKESRKSKAFRTRCQPIHELLGHATSLGEPQNREVRWRQIFNLNEMSWAKGHMFQSQVLFPATGYVSMAYEASVQLLDESQSLQLLELQELKFHRAMTLDENSAGVDVIFRINVTHHSSEYIKAKFACYSGPVDAGDQELQTDDRLNFSGQARLNLGKTTSHALPPRVEPTLPMDHLDISKLYQSYSCLGLDYSGDFRIDTIRRRYNEATITTRRPQSLPSLRIHPGSLDAAFHSLLAAFSYPGDGRLWTAYLPTYIKCIRINMACPGDGHGCAAGLMIADCTVIEGDARVIVGDLDMFCAFDGHPEIQMQGAALTALETSGRKFYRNLYAENSWVRDAMYGLEPSQRVVLSESRKQLESQIERCAFFYLRKVQEIGADELESISWNHRHLINWVLEHLIPEVEAGKHVSIKKEWVDDTAELMDAWRIMHPRQIDLQLVDAVGVNLLAILRGTVPALQVMMEDNMLDKLYTEGLGCFEANQDIAVLVGQLAHQYPHMKIVEIGAGTGGATHGILAALQGRFTSYTYTDISPGFFERAREIFKKDSHHMNFKTLNIEIDISEQGFDNGAFDLVIASNVLHATRRLEDTMRNCRRFLRPGGHLLLLEITHDYVPAQLTMGTLPGWFLGIDDGRVWKPTVSVEQWDSILKATGFSGVDTSVTSLFSVMMSQAVDDSIMLLRDPLCVVPVGLPEPMLSLSNLLIISADDGLASKVVKLLNPKFKEVATISALEDIKEKKHEVFPGTVVCLFDLGTPSFHDMPERRYESLQEIVRNAGALFWVTRGSVNGSEPFASMAVGWGRSVQIESPGIKIQFLDFDCAHAVDAALLSTMLLRLALADHFNDPKVLWSFEPELAMVDGAIYIPRVRQNVVLDQRLNSGREVITQAVKLPANHLPIEICFYNGTMELHESLPSTHSDESVQMQTLVSSACKISSSDGQSNFWCLGRDPASGDKALILSRTSASITNALKSDIFRWVEDGSGDDCLQFHRLLVSLIAASTLSGVTNQVWVHGADPELTLALKSASQKRNIDIFFTTCTAKIASDGTHFIHPYITERNLRKICPTNIQTFVNMESASNRDLNSLLLACLPVCTVVRSGPQIMLQNQPSVSVLYDHATLCNFIRNYSQEIEARYPSNPTVAPTPLDPNGRIASVSQASNLAAADLEPTTTISWGNTETVEQRIRPVQHNSLFSEKKSYVLIGLTGDLGQSICLWMVEAGARYIVVCSRNPHFSPAVVEQISQRGAVLRIASVDISCRDSLRDLHANITTTMPPVGGVMNAAMVLRDRLFVNTSLTDFEAVIKPKVQGSQNLDHLFGAESNLDFFIMFSSLTCIIGNAGQAAYSAANTFMTGLVEQRRRRGLPASIVHIAMMMGLGYVHRASEEIEAGLRHKVMTLAESDLHEMLAEAIFCGNPRSNLSGELITGLKTGDTALWKENPRLWNFLRNDDGLVAEEGGQVYKRSQRIHNVETLLTEATTESMALAILEDSFVHLLGNILQIEPDKLDKETPVSSLGIDSLVAVQIRAWFLKEVGVEVPVLEVLGNNSLTQLCKNVLAGRRHNRQQDQELTSRESLRATVATEDVEWDNELDSLATEMRTLTAVNPPQLHETNGMGRCIVLTGATGVLGTHILRGLIADDRVQEVHCIAVRPRSNGADHSINQHHSKIFEHPGDLTESRLGLSPATFASLAKHADAILHVGVDNNIAKSYSELRSANVKSTQQLLAMASVCGVPVHYVSASAIATFQDGDSELPEISTSHLRPPRNIDDFNFMGLTATKWASEVLLERARGEVPVTIHRCVHMFGDSTPDSSILSAIDTYSRQLRAVPTLEMCLKGAFDLVEVAEVAAQIVAAALRSEIASKNDFVVINHCGKRKFRVQDIQQYYSEETGQIIESWTLEKWLERAEESGLKKSVASVLRQAVRSKQVLPMGSLRRGAV